MMFFRKNGPPEECSLLWGSWHYYWLPQGFFIFADEMVLKLG